MSRLKTGLIALAVSALVFGSAAIAFTSCGAEKEPTITEEIYEQIGGGGGGRELVLRMDELIDELPEPQMSVTNEDIFLWELEVLPYFGYEELLNYPVFPSAVNLTPYLDPMMHNHILGRAHCNALPGFEAPNIIEMNARTANPHSSWYGSPDRFLPTLIHELIHIQGVCGNGASSETATQVITLEILAAMVNHGNEEALYPLLIELRDIALAAMQLDAMVGGQDAIAEFEEFRSEVLGSAEAEARHAKSMRFWSQDTAHRTQLTYILRAYNANVFEIITNAFGHDGLTENLYIPDFGTRIHTAEEYDGQRPFRVDDLIYFINHADELVEEAIEDGARG